MNGCACRPPRVKRANYRAGGFSFVIRSVTFGLRPRFRSSRRTPQSRPWAWVSAAASESDCGGLVVARAAAVSLDGMQLFFGQLVLPGLRKLLNPAVVHERDRQHTLPAHPCERRHIIVGLCLRIWSEREKNTADDGGVGNVPVIVGIGIDDDEVVREFTRDVRVVPAAFLGAEVHTVASG